jgi:hypothetical protein
MKNIHLIPTDKPSRLAKHSSGSFHIVSYIAHKKGLYKMTNQHIYITSTEEIKEGDWVVKISSLYKGGGNVQKYSFIDTQFEDITFKKIILTTDPDLIKDGVQAIDDEFLQWFVENPSCEEVEVESLNIGDGKLGYVICKPKEKPKQETLEEAAEDYYKQFENLPVVRFNAFIAGGKWQAERIFGWLSNKDYLSDDVKYIKEEWFKQFPTV